MTLSSGSPATLGHARLPPSFGAEQIVSMPALEKPRRYWTEEEFYAARDAAPAGERWELIDGEVYITRYDQGDVTPAPHWRHQRLVGVLFRWLDAWLETQPVGIAFTSPLDVKLDAAVQLQPDVLVVPLDELREASYVRRILLAAEVLSPSSAHADRVQKRKACMRAGVAEYWIVDSASELIERWQAGDERPAQVADRLEWLPAGATEPFVLDVPAFFRAALPSPP